jgi:protein TonB
MNYGVCGMAALFLAGVACAETAIEVTPCPVPRLSTAAPHAEAAHNPWRYPAQARRNREHGTVSLKLLLDDQGAAQRVSLVKGSGSSALDRAATSAARSEAVRFCPIEGGAPVASGIAVVNVTYVLTERVAQL